MNGKYQLLVYADEVNMLGENLQTLRENTEIFIKASKDISLQVNSEKTNYMITSQHLSIVQNWKFIIWKCGKVKISGSNGNKIQMTFAKNLRGATGEISSFYNLSARLLIFNTHIPPVINTHTSKFCSCLLILFELWFFFFFGKGPIFKIYLLEPI